MRPAGVGRTTIRPAPVTRANDELMTFAEAVADPGTSSEADPIILGRRMTEPGGSLQNADAI